jgi:hypothetical protein
MLVETAAVAVRPSVAVFFANSSAFARPIT